MRRKHHLRKKIAVKSFLEYGYHLWVLLLLANILIAYQFHLFGFAAENDKTKQLPAAPIDSAVSGDPNAYNPTATPTLTITPTVTPTPKPPKGPVMDLTFTVPGIGSNGGNMKPLHPTRNVTVYLYATDVNSNDNKVKPVFTMQTKATFYTNKYSPLYTTFISKDIDLGDTVKDGSYQVAFKTDQSMRNLVKEKEDAIGGKIVKISRNQKAELPPQKAIMGDMSPPEGNNVMDINDYNLFIACYGKYPDCIGAKQVDLNDDGVLDGIDYNIMALGYKSNFKNGIAPPQLPTLVPSTVSKLSEIKLSPKPTKPAAKPSAAVSPVPSVVVKQSSGGNPAAGILGFFFFLLLLGGGAFALTKTQFGKDLMAKLPIKLPTKPGGTPATPIDQNVAPPAEGETPAPDAAPADPNVAPPPADAGVAESTEISLEELQAAKAGGTDAAPPAETPPAEPAPAETPAASDPSAIDKTYYVKNKSKDDKGTWVTLTDDAGPVDGLYSGDIEDGFERIKGAMVDENGKKYVKITEVLPSEG